MAQNNSNNSGMDSKDMAAVGAGIAAIAAGAYFFFGPDGKKHQKKMKSWMVKMKGDVLEKIEEAKDMSEPIYNEIVDSVSKTYAVAGKIPKEEILTLAGDLKKQWRSISRTAKSNSKPKAKAGAKKSSGSSRLKPSNSRSSKNGK